MEATKLVFDTITALSLASMTTFVQNPTISAVCTQFKNFWYMKRSSGW
jgi:hypothetical protein